MIICNGDINHAVTPLCGRQAVSCLNLCFPFHCCGLFRQPRCLRLPGRPLQGVTRQSSACSSIVLTRLSNALIYTLRKKEAKATLSRFKSWDLFTWRKQLSGCHDPHSKRSVHQGVSDPCNREAEEALASSVLYAVLGKKMILIEHKIGVREVIHHTALRNSK